MAFCGWNHFVTGMIADHEFQYIVVQVPYSIAVL